jgi:cytochrome c oxidase subunit 3
VKERTVLDVSKLPTWGFGSHSTPWWGTLGFFAIEGGGFALVIGTYLYLVMVNPKWPLGPPPSNHWPGTALLLLLLASLVPNWWISRVAHRLDLRGVRIGLAIMTVIGFATIAIRALEFATLNFRWDSNAYGSITWFILGLHATHLVTDVGDTVVILVLMFTRHAQPRRFSDVVDNAVYWYFVVASWIPLYALVYWFPRMMEP